MKNTYYKILTLLLFTITGCGSANISKWYQPDINTTWQWQLSGKVNTKYNVDLYDVDLFDTPSSAIKDLHADGRHVVCYFSAGSYEPWRPDADKFPQEAIGHKMDGWEKEKWLDIRSSKVASIMKDRLDMASGKGCDGVEPDNVDGYQNDTGFGLTSDDQEKYNLLLSREAHNRGLSIGLKNDLDQIPLLVSSFDFAINEQCHQYNECNKLKPFTKNNKPVFNAEYDDQYRYNTAKRSELCRESGREYIHTLVLPLELDDTFRYSCDK